MAVTCKCEMNEESTEGLETGNSMETNRKVIAQNNKGIYVNESEYVR